MIQNRLIAAAALALGGVLTNGIALAQQAGIVRTELQRRDLSLPGREAIQVRVDFNQGAGFPRHRHPGEEIAYVLEGTVEYRLDGKPPITLQAGDSLFIPAGTVHSARNIGTGKASELATYINEKGKPAVELVD
jgi:quercetin dioxygenase-like cupin family protein